jgi:Lar family restriction alleviation protein
MNETEELKPCPFCGAEAEIMRAGDEYEMVVAVNCSECSAHVRETDDSIDRDFDRLEAQAVAAWNKRAVEGDLRSRLKDALDIADDFKRTLTAILDAAAFSASMAKGGQK